MKPSFLHYRLATIDDVFSIMQIYQKVDSVYEESFLDHQKLLNFIKSNDFIWIVAEERETIAGVLSIMIDKEHRLSKLHRIYVNPTFFNHEDFTEMLVFAIEHLKNKNICDVLYTTTRTLTLEQQEMTIKLGFKILGIFPNAMGADTTRLNGLTAYFFNDILTQKRYSEFSIHPKVSHFYEIVRKECKLPKFSIATNFEPKNQNAETLPILEVITAPKFVMHKFEKLKERKFLSVNFYPFQEPNILITSPDQNIEIFISIIPEICFAAIIGERLEMCIHPVALYKEIISLLHNMNISYIEVINDASDLWAIDCILKAGFLPCVYFPCLKDHGKERRDYVIFAKSYENYYSLPKNVHPTYIAYLQAYYQLLKNIPLF